VAGNNEERNGREVKPKKEVMKGWGEKMKEKEK